MKWYALYRDGQLLGVRQGEGTPEVRDFGVGELYGAKYDVNEVLFNKDMNSLIIPVS